MSRRHGLQALDPELTARWDALARATGAPPYVRPGWLGAWADAFGRADDLRLLTVERDGELAAAVPLLAGARSLRTPTNHETPLFAPIARDPEAAAELADRLVAAGRTLDLGALVADAPTTGALRAAAVAARAPVLERPVCRSPWIDTTGTPDEFLRRLSKNRRHGMRRLRHRMADLGEVTLDVRDGSSELGALLAECFRLEARAWKLAASSAIESSPATVRFYSRAARWAADEGLLRLAFLRIDDRAVAAGYCLRSGGTLSFLKLGMDDEAAKLGPGIVLTHHLVDHACTDPELTELDLLGDSEGYKVDLASGFREQVRMQIFGHRLTGAARRATVAGTDRLRTDLVTRLPQPTRDRLSAWRNRARSVTTRSTTA